MRGDLAFQNGVADTGFSETERAAILSHLERILANPLFSHSRRYPNLLRYVVEQVLNGQAGELKERTLGVKVFGRDPDYDTNSDPVVRTTAGEIRKRLAQYYQECGEEEELRIELPSGSYVPEFRLPRKPAPVSKPEPPRFKPSRLPWAAAALVVLALLGIWLMAGGAKGPLDRFWGPVLESSSSVLLCAGQRQFLAALPEEQEQRDTDFASFRGPGGPITLFKLYYMGSQNVALPDVIALGALDGVLQSRGKRCFIRGECSTTFADLRSGPVVLIGAFNNDWSLRLTGPLRFSFERKGSTFRIKDAHNPARGEWALDYAQPYLKVTQDYALISRVFDRRAERLVVVAGGVAGYGTIAAGEFLSNPAYMAALAHRAPAGWERRNLQVVIGTDVINGISGPPRILEAHFW